MAKASTIRNIAESVKYEIARLGADNVVHWEVHLNWLKMLADTLQSVANLKEQNKRKEKRNARNR